MSTELANRKAALFAKTSTAALAAALLTIAAQCVDGVALTPELRMTHAWIIDELELRFPSASEAVAAAFLANELAYERGENPPDVDYVTVLLAAIPA